MADKNFSRKLKDLRLKAGYSQKEVYKHFGIPQSTFSSWEVGKSEPPGDMLIKLCQFYKCDMINSLSSDKENSVTYEEWKMVEKYRFISTHTPDGAIVVDTVLDREYSIAEKLKEQKEHIEESKKEFAQNTAYNADIRLINYYYRLASAGTGQIVFDMPPTDKIEIPDIPEYKRVDYAIGVNGNSMEPEFSNGDILLIEMTEEIDIGEIGIFIVDNESYVKKLGNGELISLNPDYENIPLTEDSKCRGRVVDKL